MYLLAFCWIYSFSAFYIISTLIVFFVKFCRTLELILDPPLIKVLWITKPIYLKKVNLMLQYKNHHIRTNIDTTKNRNNKIYRKIKWTRNQCVCMCFTIIFKKKTQSLFEEFLNFRIFKVCLTNIGTLSKNWSKQDVAELFGLRTVSYLFENCFIEIPTGNKGNLKNYAFITAA